MAWMFGLHSRKWLVLAIYIVAAAFSIFTSYVGFHQGLTTPRFLKEQEKSARVAAMDYTSHLASEMDRGRAIVEDALAEGSSRLAEEEKIGGAQPNVTNEYLKRLVGEDPGRLRVSGMGAQYYNLLAQVERLKVQREEIHRTMARIQGLREEVAALEEASPETVRPLLERVRADVPSGVLSLVFDIEYEPPPLPSAIHTAGEVAEEQWHRAVIELFRDGNLIAITVFVFAVFFDLMILGMSVTVGNLRQMGPEKAVAIEEVVSSCYGRGRSLRKGVERLLACLGHGIELRGAGWVHPYDPPAGPSRRDLLCEDMLESLGYLRQANVEGNMILYMPAPLYGRLLRFARSSGATIRRGVAEVGARPAFPGASGAALESMGAEDPSETPQ
jgi:hypothetical protein